MIPFHRQSFGFSLSPGALMQIVLIASCITETPIPLCMRTPSETRVHHFPAVHRQTHPDSNLALRGLRPPQVRCLKESGGWKGLTRRVSDSEYCCQSHSGLINVLIRHDIKGQALPSHLLAYTILAIPPTQWPFDCVQHRQRMRPVMPGTRSCMHACLVAAQPNRPRSESICSTQLQE